MELMREKIKATWAVDDALSPRRPDEAPENARFVGYAVGFNIVWCAVWSHIPGLRLDEHEAEEIANDYMFEAGWTQDENITADYVL